MRSLEIHHKSWSGHNQTSQATCYNHVKSSPASDSWYIAFDPNNCTGQGSHTSIQLKSVAKNEAL